MVLPQLMQPPMWMLTKRRMARPHPPQDQAEGVDDRNQDNKMVELTANAELIGGRVSVCCNIFEAIMKCAIGPIQLFHKQRLDNKEAKQIKAAITLP